MRRARDLIVGLAMLSTLGVGIHLAHRNTDAWTPRIGAAEATRFLPSGKALRAASLGYEPLVADLLWVRATMMFGEHYGADGDRRWYGWLYHLVDLATDLEPDFRAAYKYGAGMLRANGVFVEQSSLLFQKGMRGVPDEWYFPMGIAMNAFMYRDDKETAARYMRQAASLPGAPFYLRNLAASLLTDSNQLDTALAFLREELRNLPPGNARTAVKVKIFETEYLKVKARAEEVVADWRRRTGHYPTDPDELGEALPPDPLGGRWEWDLAPDADIGQLRSSAWQERFKAVCEETGLGPLCNRDLPEAGVEAP